jgi:hypothetical protein
VFMTTSKTFLNGIFDPLIPHKNLLIGALVVLTCSALSFTVYKMHINSREQAAQKTFSECLEEYYKMVGGAKIEQWQEIERAFAVGYERHKSANLAPYFLAFQAEALVQQKKQTEALVLMDKLLAALSKSSPLYSNYATKRALMKLDLADEAQQKVGLEELTLLAHDKHNNAKDVALFYLGHYFWSNNDVVAAKKEWTELAAINGKDSKYPSVWAQMADMKLQQLA